MRIFNYTSKPSWLLKKSILVIILRVLGMAFVYAAILFISNTYGAETYGRFAIAQTTLQFVVLIFSLGLKTSILKLTADQNFFLLNKPQNNYLKKTLYILFFSSIICSVGLHYFKDWMALHFYNDIKLKEYFNFISILVTFLLFHSVLAEFIRAKKKFWSYGLHMYVIPPLLFLLFLAVSKYYNLSESFTIFSYLLAYSIVSIILVFYLPIRNLNPFKRNYSYRSLISLSMPMMFTGLFLFISNWTDIFMLGALVSKKEVGIYSAAFKLATIALIIINAINTVFAPRISELYSKNNIKGLIAEFQKARKIIILLTLPIVVILFYFGSDILVLFGEEFSEGSNVLKLIILSLFINALSGSVDHFLNMTNNQKQLGYFTLISAILNIILNYVFISNFGLIGAALASLVSTIVLNAICILYIKQKYDFYTFRL